MLCSSTQQYEAEICVILHFLHNQVCMIHLYLPSRHYPHLCFQFFTITVISPLTFGNLSGSPAERLAGINPGPRTCGGLPRRPHGAVPRILLWPGRTYLGPSGLPGGNEGWDETGVSTLRLPLKCPSLLQCMFTNTHPRDSMACWSAWKLAAERG